MPHPFLDHAGPTVYAHRGGGAEAPENSLAAFGNAMSIGFRYLETDARVSVDGVVMAVHDDRLDRVSNGRGLVSQHTVSELSSLRLRSADGSLSAEPIPTLEELVRAWPQARWNIDAKEDRVVDPLGNLLERLGLFERCCVGAFSDRRLGRLRERFGSRLCTSLGPREVTALRAASFGWPLRETAGIIAQVPMRLPLTPAIGGRSASVPVVDRRFQAVCRRLGVPVHVWTVNDAGEMQALLDAGIEGFMTDEPRRAAAVLRARGLWPD